MFHRNDLRFLVLVATLIVTADAAARCTDLAPTKIVYVEFSGCVISQVASSFTVSVAGKSVTVTKVPGAELWKGTAETPFTIADATLTLLSDSMPAAHAECQTKATPRQDGACVAVFRIQCETTWLINVATIPENANATIRYERRRTGEGIQECPAEIPPEPEGPGQVALSRNECLLVKVGKTRLEVEIPLTFASFARNRKELRIRDVRVNQLSANASIATSDALAALGKATLQKIVTDMLFTRTGE